LEVAHVGRFLANRVIARLRADGRDGEFGLDNEYAHAFTVTVEVACLLHDIGNPPFGHFGEVAIGKWFEKNFTNAVTNELNRFDGNPQGFRIISRLAGEDSLTGMNLTLSQLGATLKYQSVAREQMRFKKFGAFESEEEALQRIRARFGLKPEQRFCMAYLMEAADDISYCLSDLEDGVEKGLLTYEGFLKDIERESSPQALKVVEVGKLAAESAPQVNGLVAFRSGVIRHLVNSAAQRYVDQHDSILSGEPNELLPDDTNEGAFLKAVKTYVKKNVYDRDVILRLEVGGLSIVRGLLDCFSPLFQIRRQDVRSMINGGRVKGRDVERRLLMLIARSHRCAYEKACDFGDDSGEMMLRGRMVVDYISGMTDSFAMETYQRLTGGRI
jgi:dGTPase